MGVEHLCYWCGRPTETYVRDEPTGRKVPLCEGCFMKIYPSKKNKQKLYFWSAIYPIITEER